MPCICGSKSTRFHSHFITDDGLIVPKMESSMDITERCRIHTAKMDDEGHHVTGNVLTLAAETIVTLRLYRDDCLKCKTDEQCPRSGHCPFRV
jgi:hypothetical protein